MDKVIREMTGSNIRLAMLHEGYIVDLQHESRHRQRRPYFT